MLELRIIERASDLDRLGPAWEALHRSSGSSNPYQTFAWQNAVWHCYLASKRGARLAVCLLSSGTKLLAILPLIRTVGSRLPIRRLELLADATLGMSGLGIIGDPSFEACEPGIWQKVRARLVKGGGWDELRLPGLAIDRVPKWAQALSARAVRQEMVLEDRTPVLTLPATYDACFAAFSSNMRKQLRRDERELRAAASLDLDVAKTGVEVEAVLPELMMLNRERYIDAGIVGAFRDPRFTAFHTQVAPLLADRGAVRVMILRHGGRPIAALYVLLDGSRYLAYQGGQASEFASYGPGTLLNCMAMQYGIEQDGITHFDFGPGEQNYKLRFKPLIEVNKAVRAYSPTPFGVALAARSWSTRRPGGEATSWAP